MRRILLTILCFLCLLHEGLSQGNIRNYVRQRTVPIPSINPLDTSRNDLQAIGDAIGDAQVVMLGEQDHGDAPAFLAKTRLVKYLHEKKGFTVLAFESDFFALNNGWDAVSKESPVIDSFLKKNIFTIWTECDACTDLFYNYLPATHAGGSPLQVTGFDNQLILDHSAKRLTAALDSVCHALALPVVSSPGYSNKLMLVDTLRKGYGGRIADTSYYAELFPFLQRIRKEMVMQLPAEHFWVMVMDNLLSSAETFRLYRPDADADARNIRDEQMARNLAWVVRVKYPGQKVIVWAANGHVAGNAYSYMPSSPKLKPMGYFFREKYGSGISSYILGLTSFGGSTGRITMKDVYQAGPPDDDGFERWVPASYAYAFTDFKGFGGGGSKQFHMKGFGHGSSYAPWISVYDGIFFIRDMYPCKRIP